MQFDVRGAAAVMNVPESTIRRWVNERQLPANGVEGQYRFSRAELLEWATKNQIDLSIDVFDEQLPESEEVCLAESLAAGGIFHEVPADDAEAAFRSVIGELSLPDGIDRDFLLQLFLTREKMGSTAIGDGIAIPHARHPVVLPLDRPLLSLCFLSKPIDFGRGQQVHTLFMLLSPTIKTHLRMLARVALLLHDEPFRQTLSARRSADEILQSVRKAEERFEHDSQVRHSER